MRQSAMFVLPAVLFALAAGQGWLQRSYVIVCPDEFVEAIQPLAEWKTLKGLNSIIVPLTVTGNTPAAVRSFLRNAWQNWPEPPGWVLLACSPDWLPGYRYENDSYYGDMEGDFLMEIPVGRLPCRNAHECSVMVAKTLAWERHPEPLDTLWYLKGTTIVNQEDTVNIDTLYGPDSRFARELWRDAGYVLTESLSNMTGHGTPDAVAAVHDGRTFLTYRGVAAGFWPGSFYGFYPRNWTNGHRMPVIVSATCATVSLAPGELMLGDTCVRYGTVEGRGGAVAFFGTTLLGTRISHFRSAAYRGFFDAVFTEGRYRLGDATLRARFRVDSLYHEEEYYWEWALLGDPELCVWSGVPQPAEVTHDTVLGLGPCRYEVLVRRGGQPVRGALVCLAMDTVLYCRDTTDASGRVVLQPAARCPGRASITVTGPDLRPYEGSCLVRALGSSFVSYLRHELNDSPPGGNGDRCLNPGETVKLQTWVVNYGDSSARAVVGTLRLADTLATVLDSVRGFGDIPGLDTSWTGPDGFRFRVSGSCPDGHRLGFELECRDTSGRSWVSRFGITVGSPNVAFGSYEVLDSSGNGNGRLDPRETAELVIRLVNSGNGAARGVSAILCCPDERLAVLDSVGFYDSIPARGSGRNQVDRFRVSAAFMLPGTELACTLRLHTSGFAETLGFVLRVGEIGERDPIPDIPGRRYWAYEDIDTAYLEHPTYDWFELRGVGTRLSLGDNQTATVDLPARFGPFRYYGRRYDRVSICSNGWLAPGLVSWVWWENRRLPDPLLIGTLAVNWDDLVPQFGGGVWYHWDSAGHRFIVEWDSVHYRMPFDSFETFQVVIFDTTRAAADGNSVFVYQYRTGNWYRSSTIGIQDPTRQIAINVVYDDCWDPAAARVTPGRAVKFTTGPPVVGVVEWSRNAGVRPERVAPTIVRGVLRLGDCYPVSGTETGGCTRSELLDISGRKVADLVPGANDVSRLPAGVYFVRTGPSASGRQPPAVRKVVLAR